MRQAPNEQYRCHNQKSIGTRFFALIPVTGLGNRTVYEELAPYGATTGGQSAPQVRPEILGNGRILVKDPVIFHISFSISHLPFLICHFQSGDWMPSSLQTK